MTYLYPRMAVEKSAFYRSRLDIGCAAMNPEQLQVVSGIISGRDVSQLIVGRARYSTYWFTYWRPTMNFVLLSIAPFKPDRYETSGDQRCYLELLPDCKTLSTNLLFHLHILGHSASIAFRKPKK